MSGRILEARIKQNVELIRQTYVESIMMYLTTGKYLTPMNDAWSKAYSLVWDVANGDFKNIGKQALSESYRATLISYARDVAMANISQKVGKGIVAEFSAQWEKYTLLAFWLAMAFDIIEPFLSKSKPKGSELFNIALKAFEDEVIDKAMKMVVANIFSMIHAEHEGEVVDRKSIKNSAKCFVMKGLQSARILKTEQGLIWDGHSVETAYINTFEKDYVTRTIEYVSDKAKKWIVEMSCPEYAKKALEMIKIEEKNVEDWISKTSFTSLSTGLTAALVTAHAEALINKEHTGGKELIAQKRTDELKVLTKLLSRNSDTYTILIVKLKLYISGRGKAIEQDKRIIEDPNEYIKKVIELKKEMDLMANEGFEGIEKFAFATDQAFKDFLLDFDPTPKFLAIYIDHLMRYGLRGQAAQMPMLIADAFCVFKLLKSQDAFTKNHELLYGARLLQHTSISDDAEELFISKIKIELGSQYASKYTRMNSDIKTSAEMTEAFKQRLHHGIIAGIELNVKALTTGIWRCERNESCKLPDEMRQCCERFEMFYKERCNGKLLHWSAALGDCEVKSTVYARPYSFVLTPYQTSLLMLYNMKDEYNVQELQNLTSLPYIIIEAQMLNLMNPKFGKLLIKENQKTPHLTPEEKVKLNKEYAFQNVRAILVPVVQYKQPKEDHLKEYKEEEKILMKQRATQVQAVLVKIMKGRRACPHNELISDAYKMITTFKAEPMFIKQQIEWLIESDYITRDETDKSRYIYVP